MTELLPLNEEQQKLVKQFRGMAIKAAKKYCKGNTHFQDLLAQGDLGLVIAASRFDPTKGFKFSTYAAWWVKSCVLGFVIQNYGPVNFGKCRRERQVMFGIRRAASKLGSEKSHDSKAMAAELKCDIETYELVHIRLNGRDVELDDLHQHDLPDKYSSIEELLVEQSQKDDIKKRVHKALWKLDYRSRQIIRDRFMRSDPLTLDAIGKRYGLVRERVRQIQLAALQKLKKIMAEDWKLIKNAA